MEQSWKEPKNQKKRLISFFQGINIMKFLLLRIFNYLRLGLMIIFFFTIKKEKNN